MHVAKFLYVIQVVSLWILRATAQTTANPLNDFISAAQGGAGAINSALSAQPTSSSSSTSSAAPSTTAPAAASATSSAAAATHHGLSKGAKTGIIVGVVLGVVFLLGLLIGLCCCLVLRRRRRRRRAVAEKYAGDVTQNPSAATPLAAGAGNHTVPHGRHSQAPSLSHHPAYRQGPQDNPFTDSAHASGEPPLYSSAGQGHGHGHGHKAVPAAGALAAGAATAYGVHHHRKSQENKEAVSGVQGAPHRGILKGTSSRSSPANTSPRPLAAEEAVNHAAQPAQHGQAPAYPSTSATTHDHGHHHGSGTAPKAMAAGALAGYGLSHAKKSNEHQRYSDGMYGQDKPITRKSVESNRNRSSGEPRPMSGLAHAQQMHHGLPPALATGPLAPRHHEMEDPEIHDQRAPPESRPLMSDSAQEPHAVSGQPSGYVHHRSSHNGLDTLPSATHRSSNVPKETLAGGAALAALQGQEERRKREKSRSRSRSRSLSRHRTSLPTQNDKDRPPTPFGLDIMGQPYEDKHADVLQSQPPSEEMKQSLNAREEPFAAGMSGADTAGQARHTRGYSTPPQVPSRSPHREKRASTMVDSSYEPSLDNNTTSSNSGDSYSAVQDPYKPATPNRSFVPPWERHQYRYSGTPPDSAGLGRPPVPWDENEATPQQRRHSPRNSYDASGRRSSRSPANSTGSRPRRLRFEDIVHDEPNYSHGYDSYDASGWSPSVGKAL